MVRVLPKDDKEDDHRNKGNRDPPTVRSCACLSSQQWVLHSGHEVQFQGQMRPRLRLPPESKVRSDFMSEHHPDIR
jgi:hypothetical protein